MSQKRIGIYVDAQHLYHAAKAAGSRFGMASARPDYSAIVTRSLREAGEWLDTDWRGIEVEVQHIYFTSKNRSLAFEKTLQRFGYTVKSYIMKSDSDGFDWDVEIVCDVFQHVLTQRLPIDLIVLVTGDGDFVPLTNRLEQIAGIPSIVLGFPGSTSSRFSVTTRWLGQEELYGE